MTEIEKNSRLNMYLNQNLLDNLDLLSEQTSVSKNGLINLAIAKLLVDYKVVDDLNKSTSAKNILKSTEYCDVLARGKVTSSDHTDVIERIHVKAKQRDEIRFAYYKPTKNNNERLVLRPLDITETELLQVFVDAIANDVFSEDFKSKLKGIL
ncbi:hypothetical protein [Bacillus cereus]|uniref:hypothetical protein n=1 Tax=Bacillus cereus TaxID=1396 RepID=UPI0018A77619|nr:hypothetical protein [Bacillus cereus]MBF8118154.1 hypothetical protein [Bacillus cereus]